MCDIVEFCWIVLILCAFEVVICMVFTYDITGVNQRCVLQNNLCYNQLKFSLEHSIVSFILWYELPLLIIWHSGSNNEQQHFIKRASNLAFKWSFKIRFKQYSEIDNTDTIHQSGLYEVDMIWRWYEFQLKKVWRS